jgi:uncharacterized protein (DUF2267 family)
MATETVKRVAVSARRSPEPDAARALLDAIQQSGSLPEGATPESVASAVLCTLARRLSGGEARQLVSALPADLQTMLQPCVVHHTELAETFGRLEFLEAVSSHFRPPPEDPEELTRIVFRLVHNHVGVKQISDVASQLPSDLRSLWREP